MTHSKAEPGRQDAEEYIVSVEAAKDALDRAASAEGAEQTGTGADIRAENGAQGGTVCVIVNPRAGGWRHVKSSAPAAAPAALVTDWLLCHNRYKPDQVQVHLLREAGAGAALARSALDAGCRAIVSVGGDGTFNDVLQGVMASGLNEAVTLGLIPMGTANVLAGVLGLPLDDPRGAARVICAGHTRSIDVGRTQTRWFALAAGIGFDAEATRRVSPYWKRRVGEPAYVVSAAKLALRYPRHAIRLVCDGGPAQAFDAYLVVVANGGQYGGRFRLGANVLLDDGLLDVYVCERSGLLAASVLRHGLALLRNRFEGVAGVRHFQVRDVVIEADTPLAIHLDGDAAGLTPLHVRVVPNALRVCVPTKGD